MSGFLVTRRHRRSLRRAVRTRCHALAVRDLRSLGDRVLDLSTRGMLLACDGPATVGDSVLVRFQTPQDGPWLDAEAEVARLVGGWRPWDPGFCVGLRFTHLDPVSRGELLTRLAGLPPPVPRRAPKLDYAETVRRIMAA